MNTQRMYFSTCILFSMLYGAILHAADPCPPKKPTRFTFTKTSDEPAYVSNGRKIPVMFTYACPRTSNLIVITLDPGKTVNLSRCIKKITLLSPGQPQERHTLVPGERIRALSPQPKGPACLS